MMNVIESPGVAQKHITSLRQHIKRRTLLVVSGDEDCLSRNLVHALELEFPWLDVAHAPVPGAACIRFEQPVALVLVDTSLLGELREHEAEIARVHPGAQFALLQPGDHAATGLEDVLACPRVRSILPMNLKLDIWLAAIRLILLGGDYLPFAFLRSAAADRAGQPQTARTAKDAAPVARLAAATNEVGFRDLTAREIQILEFVARGLQNKVIASTLKLSEHTVKIHLHNIIRKLCVHNRTEAARFYLDSVAAAGRQPIELPPAGRR